MLTITREFESMKKGRQKKVRYIQKMPQISQFSPRGKAGRPDEIELSIDQFEALNLSDYQGYNQLEGAKAMGISRPGFGRVLRKARKIIADAIVNGKMIRIRMGDAQVGVRQKTLPKKKELINFNRSQEEAVREVIWQYVRKSNKKP